MVRPVSIKLLTIKYESKKCFSSVSVELYVSVSKKNDTVEIYQHPGTCISKLSACQFLNTPTSYLCYYLWMTLIDKTLNDIHVVTCKSYHLTIIHLKQRTHLTVSSVFFVVFLFTEDNVCCLYV